MPRPRSSRRGGVGPPPDTGDLEPHKGPVPILMYHVIASPPPTAQLPQLFVEPKTFTAQTDWLARNGYRAVTPEPGVRRLVQGGGSSRRSPSSSPSTTATAGTTCSRGGRCAACTGRATSTCSLATSARSSAIGWSSGSIDDGWELDAHTISHLDLTTMSGSRLRREVAGSRQILRQRFHQPVNFFCYPAGKYNAVDDPSGSPAGYLGATTELPGEASRRRMYELHRIRVDGSDGVSGLQRKLQQAGA